MHKKFALYELAAVTAQSSQTALPRVNGAIGLGVPFTPGYVPPPPVSAPATGYAPPPPPAYYAPPPVYVAPQPVIVAPGYYDDGRGREWQERQWREQRWREREWRRHHRHDYDD